MIRVFIPTNIEFGIFKDECRRMYENVQDKITDKNSFDFICKNTFFYMFVNENSLIGAIYYFVDEEDKLYLNGFANRKMHDLNLQCLKMSTEWFDCDIYAEAQNRMSALCLLKCGFVRYKSNIFVLVKEREPGSRKEKYVF